MRAFLVAVLFALQLISACAPQPRDCQKPGIYCAGLVTDFGGVDEGLSQQAWLALADAQAGGLLDRVDFIQTTDTRDRPANIGAFADAAYDIVVTVGAGIEDETIAAAQTYPDLYFIGIQQSEGEGPAPANLALLGFNEADGGFLAGATAALLTRTRQVAAVCEADYIESVFRYCEGFRAGVEYIDEEINSIVTFRSGPEELLFRDGEWGRAAALAALDRGADVLFAVGQETASAALVAASSRGAMVIGAETDLFARLPQIRSQLVTSAILDVRTGLVVLLRDAREGHFRGGEYEGDVRLARFHNFEDRISPELRERLQALEVDLARDVVDVGIQLEPP